MTCKNLLLAAVFGFAAVLNSARADTPDLALNDPSWPTYQGSPSHWGFLDRELRPHHEFIRWSRQVQEGRPISGVAAAEGLLFTTPYVYFGPTAPLIAVNALDGEELWRVEFGEQYSVNAPAVSNGRVYVQTDNQISGSYVRAYDALTGTFAYRARFYDQWERHLAPTPIDGTIYVNGGTYGGLYSFDGGTGQQNYFTQLPQYENWTPVPYGANKLLAYTNRLDLIDRASGAPISNIAVPDYSWNGYDVAQTPVIVGDRAYYTNGGYLNAADLAAGTTPIHTPISATGQVSTDGKELFVASAGTLSVRRPSDGAQLWAFEAAPSASISGPMLVFRNHVIVSTGAETVIVNRRTHLAEVRLPYGGQLAYANDTLFIAQSDGTVTAVNEPSLDLFVDDFE